MAIHIHVYDSSFEESKHPRAPDGKFGAGGASTGGTMPLSSLKKVAAKPGGSNPGAIYEDGDGARWMVKYMPKERSRNEALASGLYEALGIDTPPVKLVDDGDKQFVASKWSEGVKGDKARLLDPKAARAAGVYDGFVADAWIANWDSVGLEYDNIVFKGDKALRIDTGGALLYRAMGSPKPFGATVGEIDSMRDPKYPAGKVFQHVTDDDIKAQVKKLSALPEAKIRALVDEMGPPDGDRMTKTLLARREYLKKRFL